MSNRWLDALKDEEGKHNTAAALRESPRTGEPGPGARSKTPIRRAAKTAKITNRHKVGDKNPQTPIDTTAKTAKTTYTGEKTSKGAEKPAAKTAKTLKPAPGPASRNIPPKVGGVYVHRGECGCDWCSSPSVPPRYVDLPKPEPLIRSEEEVFELACQRFGIEDGTPSKTSKTPEADQLGLVTMLTSEEAKAQEVENSTRGT